MRAPNLLAAISIVVCASAAAQDLVAAGQLSGPATNLAGSPASLQPLPDSPGATWLAVSASDATPAPAFLPSSSSADDPADDATPGYWAPTDLVAPVKRLPDPCAPTSAPPAARPVLLNAPCPQMDGQSESPIKPVISKPTRPLTAQEKGRLALHDIRDPGNLGSIAGFAMLSTITDSHSAYGPGVKGFARNAGVSLGGDVTGEVIGTWAVCSLFHQDPRYFRMPNASPARRVVHAVAHVVIAQGDNGRPMPNYANLITSYAGAELSNLYVPGINTNQPSTNERIFTGFLTEPIGNLVAEFLPDIASRIHVHNLIIQQLIDRISLPGPTMVTPGP